MIPSFLPLLCGWEILAPPWFMPYAQGEQPLVRMKERVSECVVFISASWPQLNDGKRTPFWKTRQRAYGFTLLVLFCKTALLISYPHTIELPI